MKWRIYRSINILFLIVKMVFLGKLRIVDSFVDSFDYVFVCIKYEEDMQFSAYPPRVRYIVIVPRC